MKVKICQNCEKIMFSALKSKLSSTPSPNANDKPVEHGNHGINSMNAALQRKFARGVHYNLKLLLRGDRNTGKSCLFKRLQVMSHMNSEILKERSRTRVQ